MTTGGRVVGRIVAPLVNTNEPEAKVVEVGVSAYSRVSAGDVVCVLETSKATMEVVAEQDGWVGELHVELDGYVTAGDLICEVYDSEPPRGPASGDGRAAAGPAPRLTRKAEAMARAAGVDLSLLPTDRFVTERDVQDLIARHAPAVELDPGLLERAGEGAVVVFGGGGLGKCLVEVIRACEGLEPLCVVDDGIPAGQDVLGVPVAGGRAALAPLGAAGARLAANGLGAIGRMQARIDVFELLERHGFGFPVLVDPSATVSPSALLGDGAQVFAAAVVSAAATVGRGTIVNTGAIVSHDCRVGDHCHLAPGAILAGDVTVGDGTLVGMGVTVALGLRIGAEARVGNGAAVTADVPDGTIVAAGSVWSG